MGYKMPPETRPQPFLPQQQPTPGQQLPPARFFRADKTYGHDAGFTCCFRQWRAEHSHCRLLHGYALSFSFVFFAEYLDKHGWIMDFGGLKSVKAWLQENFDHKILLAADDPERALFQAMADNGLCTLTIFPHIGCEAFAYYVWQHCDALLRRETNGRVRVETVAVREHGGNGAEFRAEEPPAGAQIITGALGGAG